jgi:predicted nuclease of predicted toxin-antitoxin system
MKFIVDEQLPPLLCDWIQAKGYDVVHILTLGSANSISDSNVKALSMAEKRIVITKDEDFFNSYIFQKQPYKLIYITTGNIKNRDLLNIFREKFDKLTALISEHDVIEINRTYIRIWF